MGPQLGTWPGMCPDQELSQQPFGKEVAFEQDLTLSPEWNHSLCRYCFFSCARHSQALRRTAVDKTAPAFEELTFQSEQEAGRHRKYVNYVMCEEVSTV